MGMSAKHQRQAPRIVAVGVILLVQWGHGEVLVWSDNRLDQSAPQRTVAGAPSEEGTARQPRDEAAAGGVSDLPRVEDIGAWVQFVGERTLALHYAPDVRLSQARVYRVERVTGKVEALVFSIASNTEVLPNPYLIGTIPSKSALTEEADSKSLPDGFYLIEVQGVRAGTPVSGATNFELPGIFGGLDANLRERLLNELVPKR